MNAALTLAAKDLRILLRTPSGRVDDATGLALRAGRTAHAVGLRQPGCRTPVCRSRLAPGAAPGEAAPGWKPLDVSIDAVTRERRRPQNGFAITFPQGLVWGIIGCVMSFAIGLVTERTQGTLLRLRLSPVGPSSVLAGKALACYLTIVGVEALILGVGVVLFGLRVGSPVLLLVSAMVVPLAFVGIMMCLAALGRTEQAAAGAAWAVIAPLAMIGGGMIPLIAMPPSMISVSHISPVKWAILAFEGAIWRGLSAVELALPLAILLVIGALGLLLGTRAFRLSAYES
jgi:ABC-2 type transport system permease protein